jgi:hypothetical protein
MNRGWTSEWFRGWAACPALQQRPKKNRGTGPNDNSAVCINANAFFNLNDLNVPSAAATLSTDILEWSVELEVNALQLSFPW